MVPTTEPRRDERREARKAVAEAKRASSESRKLAKTLSRDARVRLEALTASARADVELAKKELGDNPRRATRTAKRAAARLESASVRATASGDTRRKALADSDAKKRAKTIKHRRVQAKQARKMAKSAAFHALVASVVVPGDREKAAADFARDEKLRDRVARYARR